MNATGSQEIGVLLDGDEAARQLNLQRSWTGVESNPHIVRYAPQELLDVLEPQ